MLTASYMFPDYEFRPEYLHLTDSLVGHVGIDPIDAPRVIATGSHYSAKGYCTGSWFALPTCIHREKY